MALARALAMRPDVLLLDEPTSALDPELVGEVEKSIVDAAKSGQTMILVSHDMNFIYQVADKVLFLEKVISLNKEHLMKSLTIQKKSEQRILRFLFKTISLRWDFCYNRKGDGIGLHF